MSQINTQQFRSANTSADRETVKGELQKLDCRKETTKQKSSRKEKPENCNAKRDHGVIVATYMKWLHKHKHVCPFDMAAKKANAVLD